MDNLLSKMVKTKFILLLSVIEHDNFLYEWAKTYT